MIRTIAVDFDKVVHRYSREWADGTIYDPPMDGALDGLSTLMEHYSVFIHTSRNPRQVADWLAAHGFTTTTVHPSDSIRFWNERGTLLVTDRKLPASMYLDDRALPFTSWRQALLDLLPGKADQARRQRVEQVLREGWPGLDGLVVEHLAVIVEGLADVAAQSGGGVAHV